jgi:site-specific recombinase XerD
MANPKHRGVFESPKHSGIWHIVYYDADHKRHREKVGPRQAAIGAYELRKTEIRLGKFFPPRRDTIRFGELVKEALAHKQAHLAPASYLMDKNRAEKLLDGWRELAAGAITPQRIDERLTALRQGRFVPHGPVRPALTGSTVNRYRSLLSSIFAFAVRTGRISANPVRLVPRYKENEHRTRYLDEDEEKGLRKAIRKNCPGREPELDLALNTGMRRGEQFSLRWDQVDLQGGRLTVVRGKTGRRFIPINAAARTALERLHAHSNGSAFVCPETKRQEQRDWRRWFEDSVRLAGIENFRWHDLRHTFASRLVMAGVDLRTVQELLGHKSILQTMRYSHLAPSHLNAAVEKLCPKPVTATKTATGVQEKPRKIVKMR